MSNSTPALTKEVTLIKELCPRAHVRLTRLSLLGPLLEEFAAGLLATGLSLNSVRNRIRKAPEFEAVRVPHGDFEASRLTKSQLLALGPASARHDMHLLSLTRSLADYLDELGLLAVATPTPSDQLLVKYQQHLREVRGLAPSTVRTHVRLSRELLEFLEFDEQPDVLRDLRSPRLEGFVNGIARRYVHAATIGNRSAVAASSGRSKRPAALSRLHAVDLRRSATAAGLAVKAHYDVDRRGDGGASGLPREAIRQAPCRELTECRLGRGRAYRKQATVMAAVA